MTVRLLRFAALLSLVQPLAGCSQAPIVADKGGSDVGKPASSPQAPIAAGTRIVVFGDSLYAGYQLGPNDGFAPQLQRALAARGITARVDNAGVSGDTTAAGLQRLAFTLDGISPKPDLVLVGLGANDMLRGLDPAQTRTNLDAILTELKRREIPAMLTGMVAAPNMGPDYAARFNPIYPDLAAKFGVPLYPFFLDGVVGQRPLLLADGLHPNARGIDSIVGRIAPMVAGALPE